ncbi:MAG: trigger factor [Acidimicrobiales bacterium]
MKSSVEALEGNKVKVTVEVEAAEFDKDLDSAFKVLAREVRLPGFRPGKAPRKVLEARIGSGYAREQAFRDGLPNYYAAACKEHDVDVIAPPEIEITDGHEAGPVTFDAIVEVRPSITVTGYEALTVEVANPVVDESDVDASMERFLSRFSELVDVDRPGAAGDTALVDISGTYEGEPLPGLTASDYRHVIGTESVVPEIDAHIDGASAGDTLVFSAAHPDEDEDGDLEFTIVVKAIQESVPPEATDEFIAENSEFATIAEMRANFASTMLEQRRSQAVSARRNGVAEQVAALVDADDLPNRWSTSRSKPGAGVCDAAPVAGTRPGSVPPVHRAEPRRHHGRHAGYGRNLRPPRSGPSGNRRSRKI